MDKKTISKISIPALLISITVVFILGETIAFAEETKTLPGYVQHRARKVTAGKEQEAIKRSIEMNEHFRSIGVIPPRKYLEKTDEGTIFHWIAEFPNKASRVKQRAANKGDPAMNAIREKYPDIFEGKMNVYDWQAIE